VSLGARSQPLYSPEGAGRDDDRGRDRDAHGGDLVAVNGILHHKLYSDSGVTFMDAIAPATLGYVPNKTADLVLGEAGGVQHVAK
jgi:hypothetical protein